MRRTLTLAIILILVSALVLMVPDPNSVMVQAASPTLVVSPTSGPPGTLVTVTGSGFAVNETGITITFDGIPITLGIAANPLGNWTSTFTAPSSASGQHSVSAYGTATLPGSVLPILFTVVNPLITISPTGGPPGTLVTVTGSGFGTNETGITITFDGNPVTPGIAANSLGNWNGTFAIPAASSGYHTISAYGSTTLASSVTTINFTVVNPALTISPAGGPPGTLVTVTGSGFNASERGINITFDVRSVTSGISADSLGNWNGTFTVPASASGSHTVSAYGSTTPASSVASANFTVSAVITVSPASGPPGTQVTVTGSGFGANERGITITFDVRAVTPGISADSLGNWSGTFTIPASASGAHTVSAYGPTTLPSSSAGITFMVSAVIAVSPASGPPGTPVTVTGSGFGANETGITITFDRTPVTSGIPSNSLGNWTGTFSIPASASGYHTVSAYGPTTPAGSVTGLTFMVGAAISISPTGGSPGTLVTVTGSGFGANETGITITYDGNPNTSGISAGPLGNWSGTFTVPASTSGSHNVRAYGLLTQTGSVGSANFKVTPSISISPASGYVGQTVEISGFGFTAGSPLTFTYDEKEIPAERVTTDAAGSFEKSLVTPKSKGGNHTISVVDWQKNSAKVVFSMDSTPPPLPGPASPGDGDRLGILGNITPTFMWSTVTDPSGVTYILQLSLTSEFSQPVLEKTDIAVNRYTLTATEALPRGQYYWRVMATDGASNGSAWSQPRLLKSGLMSVWVLAVIIVLAIVAVGAGIYFGLVRPRARRREVVAVHEVLVPQIVPGEWHTIESEETPKERQLPWRLALPAPTKGAKTLSTEDRARLKVIVDFTQSLPLVEPDYDINWLVDLIETGMGTHMSVAAYEQLLKGEIQVRYEPAWMRHPAYQDLTTLLQGQSILQELNTFVNDVDHCASEANSLIQQIYRDAITELSPVFLERGGWGFISAVYTDAVSWFAGKYLRDPSERDYVIKPRGAPDDGAKERWLCGDEATSFTGELILASDNEEALRLQALHLKLRRTWRSNDQAKQVAAMIIQLQLLRSRLLGIFSQFSELKQ